MCYRCGSRGHIQKKNCPLGNKTRLEEGNVGVKKDDDEITGTKIPFACREESGDKGAVGGNDS